MKFISILLVLIYGYQAQAQNTKYNNYDSSKYYFNKLKYATSYIMEKNSNKKYNVSYTSKDLYDTSISYLNPFSINLNLLNQIKDFNEITRFINITTFLDFFFIQLNYPIPLNYRHPESLSIKETILLNNKKNNSSKKINNEEKRKYLNSKLNYIINKKEKISNFYFLPSVTIKKQDFFQDNVFNSINFSNAILEPYDYENKKFIISNQNCKKIKLDFLSTEEQNKYRLIEILYDKRNIPYYILIPIESLIISKDNLNAINLIKNYESFNKEYIRNNNIPLPVTRKAVPFSVKGNTILNGDNLNNVLEQTGKIINTNIYEEDDTMINIFDTMKIFNKPFIKERRVNLNLFCSIDSLKLLDNNEINILENITISDYVTSDIEKYIIYINPIYFDIRTPVIDQLIFKSNWERSEKYLFKKNKIRKELSQ